MRFDYKAYERAFPKQEKPRPVVEAEDVMTVKPPEEVEEVNDPVEERKESVDDGVGTDSESDTE